VCLEFPTYNERPLRAAGAIHQRYTLPIVQRPGKGITVREDGEALESEIGETGPRTGSSPYCTLQTKRTCIGYSEDG